MCFVYGLKTHQYFYDKETFEANSDDFAKIDPKIKESTKEEVFDNSL
jgi:hypothetical protein